MRRLLSIIFISILTAGIAEAQTVLTVENVRKMALEYNRQYLAAKKNLEKARGEIISVRSGALPQISLNGYYARNLLDRELFFGGEKIPISLNNDFDLALTFSQPLYVGGKVGTAMKIARYYEEYSKEVLRQVEAEIVFQAESIFFAAALAESNLEVIRKAYEQLNYNLEVVEKQYGQGMISEYERLRARVEKGNLEPQLIGAESEVNLAQKRLKSFLGLPLNEKITLAIDLSDTSLVEMPALDSLEEAALNNRPELRQADLQKKVYDKAVRIAKGNWIYPNVSLNTTYQVTASSDDFKLREREVSKSWSAALLINIPLFDGGKTIGEVRKARVDYYNAVLAEQQALDDIRLEVEQAHDNFQMARKALEVQKETIAQAEEGLRIANLRYQSGIGTQLEVLSAQTALTDARTNLARAVYNYRLARAALKKAISVEM